MNPIKAIDKAIEKNPALAVAGVALGVMIIAAIFPAVVTKPAGLVAGAVNRFRATIAA